ncbi:MAG: CvpA family protein [Clostridia bacterium]|nr:CvpA family protein [Clostridia bacterium]
MNFILDLVLILLFALIVFVYIKRGFLRSVIRVIEIAAAGVAAYFFGGKVADLYAKSAIAQSISGSVKTGLEKLLTNNGTAEKPVFDLSSLFSSMPEKFRNMIEVSGISEESLSESFGGLKEATAIDLSSLADKIAGPLTNTVCKVLGYVTVFVVALIIFMILGWLICQVVELPGLKKLDGTLGGILGVFIGTVYVGVICLIIGLLVEKQLLGDYNSSVKTLAENSFLLRLFCKGSPFGFTNIK